MTSPFDTIVIGAGQAGLAAGYYLRRAALSFTILEAGAQPAGSWPHYYGSLTFFSPARYASLPGLRFPGSPDHYPTRDEVIAYLTGYAAHFQLPVVTNARVETVERAGVLFRVVDRSRTCYVARTVIAATGSFHRPHIPRLPGQGAFRGRLLYSSGYRTPEPFRGQRVVVVGAGNSAVQIAVELARQARVTLATRRPVSFVRQRLLGRDIHFWLWLTRLDRLPLGRWITLHEPNPVLGTGTYRAALVGANPDRRPMFDAFSPEGVVWANGDEEAVDAVIFATGYRPNLSYLEPLGALNSDGSARHLAGVSQMTPGLYFLGLAAQRSFASATLRGVSTDAAFIVNRLRRDLKAGSGWEARRQ